MSLTKSGESIEKSVDAFAVSAIDIFSDLSLHERQLIANKMRPRLYPMGHFIVSNSTGGRDVFFLIDGTVRACAYSANGKQVQFEDLLPGQMFGEIAAVDGGSRTSDCIAVTNVVLATMSHTDFHEVLSEYASVNHAVLRRLTSVIRRQMERVFEFSTAPVAERLRYELLRLASAHDNGEAKIAVINPPTHADIAARISTHREAVTREMRKLENAGIIAWNRGSCVVHDVNALTQF